MTQKAKNQWQMSGASVGTSHPRPCSGRKTLRRCKNSGVTDNVVLIDDDTDEFDNVIVIDVPESVSKELNGSSSGIGEKYPWRNVIFIDDDEGTENNNPHAGVNEKGNVPNGRASPSPDADMGRNVSVANDDGPSVPQYVSPVKISKCKRTYSGKSVARNHYGLGSGSDIDLSDDDFPDCELVEDSSGKCREQWEKASRNRKCRNPDDQSGVRFSVNKSGVSPKFHEGTGAESTTSERCEESNSGKSRISCKFQEGTEAESTSERCEESMDCSNFGKTPCAVDESSPSNVTRNGPQDFPSYNSECGYFLRKTRSKTSFHDTQMNANCKVYPSNEGQLKYENSVIRESGEELLTSLSNLLFENEGDAVLTGMESCIISDREKLKETDEYKKALEEEWAARQQALKIQAAEAQQLRQLRKRRKAEQSRLLEMEKRQKQRLEEIRETQKKDAEHMNLKESIRAEIRSRLRKLELECHDMASVLRKLGINVGSEHEVRAACKRALFTFHPDRVSKFDAKQQVEAEEKFKLISRMKERFRL